MSALVWSARLVVVLPVLAALVGALVPRGSRGAIAAVAVTGAAATLVAALIELAATAGPSSATGVSLLGSVPTGAGAVSLDLRADRLSAVVAVMVALVALCVQAYSTAYQ
ncbi:MAG TPA: hypothetical protein VF661_01500, partial [Actinomycetales bacterium]